MALAVLLDEMLSGAIAAQLRAKGHDVIAVVEDSSLVGLPDAELLEHAAATNRALVSANIKDFVPLDQQCKATGKTHGGIVLISSKTFPQDRGFVGAVVSALDEALRADLLRSDNVVFLERADAGR